MPLAYSTAHAYAKAYSSPEPTLLAHINQETAALPGANMLAGHLQGRVLAIFSQMIKPQNILEIGTYTGYSTLCLAEGLATDGILYTIDCNAALADRVNRYFAQADKGHQIHHRTGKALEIIPQLQEQFDLVFIDADKQNYVHYYDLCLTKLNSGGFLIIDNVLWGGKVCETNPQKVDKKTQYIINLNNKVQHDSRVTHVLFPIRDGLMVVRKK